jgi:lipopolysaccharide transport system ATP-binding protein
MNTALRATDISKRFRLRSGTKAALDMLFPRPGRETDTIDALSGVSLSIQAGEVLGIIGRNGSGKSTLLRILGNLSKPDSGTIETSDALYLSGFTYGTNPYLTVKDNIRLICSIMGLRRQEIESKMGEILDFAGLVRFGDTETLKLSTGMIARINIAATLFSVEHRRPSVLLLDEVLSGGIDLEFQEKNLKKIAELINAGSAVALVSHDMRIIQEHSDRVIWLESGKIKSEGETEAVIAEYIAASTHGTKA